MAISDAQKLDYLWKKVGFAVTKTDVSAIKGATNESIPSPTLIRADKVWTDSAAIPGVLPAASTSVVQVYSDAGTGVTATLECTQDLTASPRRSWRTGATDWIPPEFGSTYQLKVYVDNTGSSTPQTTGTQLFAAGSNNDDEWFFDYSSGTLNFIGDNLPSQVIAGKSIYVSGGRYIGAFGASGALDPNAILYTNGVISSGNVEVNADLLVTGNLLVLGNTTTFNTEVLNVEDLNITLGNGAASAAMTNGAGITVFAANASITYDQPNDVWSFNRGISINGDIAANSTVVTAVYDVVETTGNIAGASAADGTYTGVASTTSGNGQGATFTITGYLGTYTIDAVDTGGTGYAVGDTITVAGNLLGGLTPGNDLTFTVDTLTSRDVISTAARNIGSIASPFGNLYLSNSLYVGNTAAFTANGPNVTLTANSFNVEGTFTVNGVPVAGSGGTVGTPTDGNLADGAYTSITSDTTLSDAVDILNSVIYNVSRSTYVRSVEFTATPTTGGAGTTVTLTVSAVGNANRYDVDWGDGTANTTGATGPTITHVYATNVNSPFTVVVRGYNNAGSSYGSEATQTRADYIQIATADPVVGFAVYNVSTGGTALSGNNLYLIEGDSLYLDNNTTNTDGANVAYTIAWGDGNTTAINSDTDDGGANVAALRATHVYGTGTSTGTGVATVTLTLTSHSTAAPGVVPTSSSTSLKIYNPNIAAPNTLSSKTITLNETSVGTSPKLVSGFTDQSSGIGTYVAGSSIVRLTANTGTYDTAVMSTYAYDANVGVVSAVVNGAYDGNISLTDADNTGTATSLVLSSESDYNLLDANGATVTFATSIYYPGLYRGYKAAVSKSANQLGQGVNTLQLRYSDNDSGTNEIATNAVQFVKDDLTVTPTATAGVLEQSSAVLRYISGVPYYNVGSTLNFSAITIGNLTGQAYTDSVNPLSITAGTRYEGTTADAVSTTLTYTFAQIDDSTNSMLGTGSIPLANVGRTTPYTIANITVPITSSSVRAIQNIGVRATNVNGSGTANESNVKVAVHTAAQTGINETAVGVSGALGDGTYTDAAKRTWSFNAETTDTPSFTGAGSNYYTATAFTETSDPGVQGTKEATIRLGVLKHDVSDYSTGYLPAGPNRSGDTGTQYATFVFRRAVVSNFSIGITAPNGVAGVWIAAPGTAIDSASTISGWLDCGTAYAGSGVPGANTGAGGNGSNGCATTPGSRIIPNAALSGSYAMTLGGENLTNASNNCCLVRIALSAGQTVTALSIS